MQATAFVVGPDEAPAGALKELARQVGFLGVHSFRSVKDLEREVQATPSIFMLFSAVGRLRNLRTIVDAVRASTDPRVRFAPLIYFSETPSLEMIRTCIGMGFDDIITLPFTLKRVRERLVRQLNSPLAYYQTETYFGPDRRNRLPHEDGHAMRGSGGTHRRFDIVRTTDGVSVTSGERQVMI